MARAALAALLTCVLALAGCATLADLGRLQSDLDAAGYGSTSINHNTTNGFSVLSVSVSMPDGVPADEDAEEVAEIVWTKYPSDFDQLVITMNGAVRMEATPDDLTELFGARPADVADPSGDSGGSGALTVILVLAGAAVFAGLMVLLWYRGRRPPPPVAPPSGYQPGGHFQYPPRPPQG